MNWSVVTERTNVVFVTNAVSGGVTVYATQEPVATNLVTAVVTNFVPVFMTNLVQVPVTNLVAKPEALGAIERDNRDAVPDFAQQLTGSGVDLNPLVCHLNPLPWL